MAAEFPNEGVKLSWIVQDFIPTICGGRDKLESLTTWQVLERVTKRETANTSYCQKLKDQGKSGQSDHVGKPNVFVSHWFGYMFLDVVDALWNHLKEDEADTAILWWDLFSINQHVERDGWTFDWLSTTFKSAIQEIGRVVMVMSPWNDPIPYKRAWCVFEAYCAISVGARFEIALGEKQEEKFLDDVSSLGVVSTVNKMLAEVGSEKSQSSNNTEKDNIFNVIRSEIGFEKLDAELFERYRSWVASMAIKLAEDRSSSIPDSKDRPPYIYHEIAADIWLMQGRYNEAERLQLKCLEARKQKLGEDHPGTLTSLNNLAMLHYQQGNYDTAERLFIQALEGQTKSLGENHPDTLTTMHNLAMLYNSQGKYDEAERLTSQCLKTRTKNLGEDHPDTLRTMSNLAMLYKSKGKYDEAKPLYLQCLETRKQTLGEDHPFTLTTMNNLALLYESQGKHDEAERLLMKCLETQTQKLGRDHRDTLTTMNNLALLYSSQGKYDEAEPLYLNCWETQSHKLGEDHPFTLTTMNNLALCYESQGKYDGAERLLVKCLEMTVKKLGEDHPDVLTSKNNLAILYCSQGKYDEAERLLLKCLETQTQKLGEAHPDTLTSRYNLASLYDSQTEVVWKRESRISEKNTLTHHWRPVTIRKGKHNEADLFDDDLTAG